MTNDNSLTEHSTNNERLAKNTLVLYLRMFITVGISFYITRVVLANLGVSDYGLYNVIGGVVSMFYIISSTLQNAISRFLTIELGRNDKEKLNSVFVTSFNIILLFSLLVVLLGETVGLWFVNNKLNIDTGRMTAANWIYQFTLVSFIMEMVSIPFVSLIIAHEKMKAFATFQVLSVVLKLGVALILPYAPTDRLVFYGFLLMLVALSNNVIYLIYSKRHFVECLYKFFIDKALFKELFSFAGWMSLCACSVLLATSGVNIILNMFYGTVVNAAQGVATQVKNAAGAFAKNFMVALTPQITKSVAQKDDANAIALVFRGAKFSYLLLFMLVGPIFFETDALLDLWLKEVPPYASIFLKLILISQLVDVLFQTTFILNNAIGHIKWFQITYSSISLLNLPLSYLLLYLGCPPYSVMVVYLVLYLILFIPCFRINGKYIAITFGDFCRKVVQPLLIVSVISMGTGALLHYCVKTSLIQMFINMALTFIVFAVSTYFVGIDKNERDFCLNMIRSKLPKHQS